MPIDEACNWADFAAQCDLDQWYLVVFRSTRKPSADDARLEELGEKARQEASEQPGYLFYFKGDVKSGTDRLRNLSFCMWRSRAEAEAAARRPSHKTAIEVGLGMYKEYKVERYDAKVRREGGRAWVEFALLV
jgi:heme-degrading monooxygenase HmoA